MIKNDLFQFGYIQKTSGFKGHLIISLDVDHPERYSDLKELFIETVPGNFVLNHLVSCELNKNRTLTILVEGIDTFEKAQTFLKKNVHLPLTFLPSLDDRSFYFHEIIGFKVLDPEHGMIGIAEAVIESPGNNILQVKRERMEILIPLRKEFIQRVDRKKKELHITAPDGLIDMYLKKKNDEEE